MVERDGCGARPSLVSQVEPPAIDVLGELIADQALALRQALATCRTTAARHDALTKMNEMLVRHRVDLQNQVEAMGKVRDRLADDLVEAERVRDLLEIAVILILGGRKGAKLQRFTREISSLPQDERLSRITAWLKENLPRKR